MEQFEITLQLESRVPLNEGELEEIAQACLDALHRDAAFVAMGPVVSGDPETNVIEVDFTMAAESPEDLHEKIGPLAALLGRAHASWQYSGSKTARREPVLTA